MSTTTPNLGLAKPAAPDLVDITVIDTDLDKLDTAIGPRASKTTTQTVANTTTETVLHTLTVAASTSVQGRAWRFSLFGTAGITGTPTIRFRLRAGGLTGVILADTGALTMAAAGDWQVEAEALAKTAVSSTATWAGFIRLADTFGTTLPLAVDVDTASNQTLDTTVAQDLVVTVQWGTANASNTLSAVAGYARQVV